MPLPPLPKRMGALLNAKDVPAIADAPAPVPVKAAVKQTESKKAAPVAKLAPNEKLTPNAKPSLPADKSASQQAKPTLPTVKPSLAPPVPAAARPAKKVRLPSAQRKLFVLDTNVLLHDSNSMFKFQEHDIFLPMIVLEELDHQKKGMSEVARNARQVSRSLDTLVNNGKSLDKGVALDGAGNTEALGSLFFQTTALSSTLPIELPMGKADNAILGVVHALQGLHPKREVVLVSKDINMRLKAQALSLTAEDYYNDHVLDDSDLLYDGVMPLPENFWIKHGKDVESWQQGGTTYYRVSGPLCSEFIVNEFVF